MSDQHPTPPLPDSTASRVLSTDAAASAPRRRSRRWPWLIALLAVLALAVGAWFAGEYIARGIVERSIRDQIVSRLDVPADQHIDVAVRGQVLPQLISGHLDDVTVSANDVSFGPLSGDVEVHAAGIPIRGNAPLQSASATVRLDQSQVRALLSTVEGFPADAVTLEAPDVVMSTSLQLFALSVPVGVSLTPSASDGDLVLTPRTLRVSGAEVSADVLVDQFGAVARTVVRDWKVCVAQYFPAGLTLSGVRVDGQQVVADITVNPAITVDAALQQKGSCA
ncbi:DUF2993 domain-containing protein [Microbacterium sp. VKM Ac-2870]|uniref:LmeA family phospholipid-binding protein n=1 Tax=Microbacterium sp. VKM Ac-2870 TaxID=2783825 RepID=UPI00188A29FC|nr:DUF2993 domain-containing protein [Microbacterium sp. VKM Ac-2870]MBF4561785.1 DUF2993 domain-containing protein [Microbacterium sp. VKM Ac-2870]